MKNEIKYVGPVKGSRHHLRFASLPHIYNATSKLIGFIKNVANNQKRWQRKK